MTLRHAEGSGVVSSTWTGRRSRAVPLDQDDPRVIAARQAERRLYDYYGLEPAHHLVALPRLGLRVRVTEVGSGPPVLVVPGNTGDGFPFAPLLPHLPGRRVIVLNRPGGGLSEGMDHTTVGFRDLARYTLSSVLDSLGIDRVPIVAHSMGGHWSQWFAMDRPDRVTALALLGVPGNVLTTRPPLALRLASVRGLNRLVVRATIPRRTQDALKGLGFLGHHRRPSNGCPPRWGSATSPSIGSRTIRCRPGPSWR